MKRFCTKCGLELVQEKDTYWNWVKNNNYLDKFDKYSGERKEYLGFKYRCPNERWYNSHDLYFISN